MIWYKLQNSVTEIDVGTTALMLCKLVMYDKRTDFASYILWFTYTCIMSLVIKYTHFFDNLGVLWRWKKYESSI